MKGRGRCQRQWLTTILGYFYIFLTMVTAAQPATDFTTAEYASTSTGDGPRAAAQLLSLNVTSLAAHWDLLDASNDYDITVAALQETRHTTEKLPDFSKVLHLHGWHGVWGNPLECTARHQAEGHGKRACDKTSAIALNGGVGILAPAHHALVCDRDLERQEHQLFTTTRWKEVFVPIRPHNTATINGFYVASVYGQAGANNDDLFESVWRAAARRGSAPYFICLDAQTHWQQSTIITHVCQHDGWANVAAGYPDEHAPTYGRAADWDRHSWDNNVTQIDYIFANATARHLVRDFQLLRDLSCPQHLGLRITLDCDAFEARVYRWRQPHPYTIPTGKDKLPDEEAQAIAQCYVNQHIGDFQRAAQNDDVNQMFLVASQCAEAYLTHIQPPMATASTAGRGTPPTFVQGWATPPIHPEAGAISRYQWRFHKLQLKLRELYRRMQTLDNGGQLTYLNWVNATKLWERICSEVQRLRPTAASWPAWWDPATVPDANSVNLILTSIEYDAKLYRNYLSQRRAHAWTQRLHQSCKQGRQAACKWVKAENAEPVTFLKHPDTKDITTDVPAMLNLMKLVWDPIFARYRHTQDIPTWDDFRREYHRELPTPTACATPTLTDGDVQGFLQHRPARKATGLDGWRTAEAKALPNPITNLFAGTLRQMQTTGVIPEAFYSIPNPCLRKGLGEFPAEQRILSVLSVWLYAWTVPTYHKLEAWRRTWTHATSYGATAGATIQDVSTAHALWVEWASHMGLPLCGIALDREKTSTTSSHKFASGSSNTPAAQAKSYRSDVPSMLASDATFAWQARTTPTRLIAPTVTSRGAHFPSTTLSF